MLSVVMPVYRSEHYLESTIDELRASLGQRGRFEIVLVNDGSPDRVQAVIDKLTEDPRVRSVELAANVGQHRAIMRGLAETNGDVVVTIDDDGQNPPEAVLAVADTLMTSDKDVVYGRFEQIEQGVARRAASRVNRLISRYTIRNTDSVAITNVRAIRGDLARWLARSQSNYPYIDALIFRATRHIGEVQVPHRPRESGTSTYSISGLLRLWISHITTMSTAPLQLAIVGSLAVSIAGALVGAGQLIRVLIDQRAPEGWLSLFTAVTFLFSVLFAFLGIISAYIGRMYVSMNESSEVWDRSAASKSAAANDERHSQ